MEFIEIYESVSGFLDSGAFSAITTAVLVYLAILWIAVLIWIARDIVHRSNNLFFQVIAILLGFLFIPGLILYLIIRPSRTLADKYDEELERRAFLESVSETDEECQMCHTPLRKEYIFCPTCREQLRQVCKCGKVLEKEWQVCPQCGIVIAEMKEADKKKSAPKKKVAPSKAATKKTTKK